MKNRKMLLYKKIMVTVLSSGMLLLPNWSYALPQGGVVVGGSGTIGTPSGGELNITGNGGHMAIDWNSSNIGKGETVNFQQLQAVLNYVTGSQRSEIFGNLNGNGAHVFLLNPNGILFGESAQVNVGSLTASTRSLSEQARRGFNGTLGKLDSEGISKIQADIVNLGTIAANTINFEGNNISIIKADTLQIQGGDLSKVSLKAKNNINIGYEVTDKTNVNTISQKASALGLRGRTLDGTAKAVNDCLLISTVDELQAIQNNLNGNYMLKGDIDASATKGWNSGAGFKPIGGDGSGFAGVFDGMGHAINDLYINRASDDYVGLFGVVGQDGILKNFTLTGAVTGRHETGAITGMNKGSISHVINEAKVVGQSTVGGIVGYNAGRLEVVTNKGFVNGSQRTGGISGYNAATGIISEAVNNADVTGLAKEPPYIGGICGYNEGGRVEKIKNYGTVTGALDIGGIVGHNYGGVIDTAENYGKVVGLNTPELNNKQQVGGIAGMNRGNGIINNAYNEGAVEGYVLVGGIVGTNFISGTVSNVVNKGSVSAEKQVGGIAGKNDDIIINAKNDAAVAGEDYIGGIVGYNEAYTTGRLENVNNSFNGIVTGNGKYIGGITGRNDTKGTIINSSNQGNINAVNASYVSGIVGYNYGIIINTANEANISGGVEKIGGIAGYNNAGTIKNCYNTGSLAGSSQCIGGIVGYNKVGTIENCYNTGNIDCKDYTGGIAGYNNAGELINNYNTGNIAGDSKYTGGITGYNNAGKIINNYNTGSIAGVSQYIGGISGLSIKGSIENCYNTGTISGNHYLGGITGKNDTDNTIKNSYNIGEILSKNTSQYVGGICGYSNGAVINVYSVSKITGKSNYGPLIGKTGQYSTVNNAYYYDFTVACYKKHDDNAEYTTLEAFNKAFAEGLGEDDKKAWKTGQKQTAPYLQSFLETISGDVGNVEATAGSDCKAVLLARLQALGITVDPDKILGLENLAAGEYDLSELLYSTQDGYDLQLTGKLVLKAEPRPEPPKPGPVPDMGDKYAAALISIQKKVPYMWEETVPDDRRLHIDEQRRIRLDSNSVKIEPAIFDEINLQEAEILKE